MENKLRSLDECIEIVNSAIEKNEISFCFLEDAPKLVKWFSSGEYCAYKNTVYVPSFHLNLSTSTNATDRTLATAKLLPWVIAIKDGKTDTYLNMRKLITDYKQRSFYFLYEYMFLTASEVEYADLVFGGFVSTRKTFWGRKVPPEIVTLYLKSLLEQQKGT